MSPKYKTASTTGHHFSGCYKQLSLTKILFCATMLLYVGCESPSQTKPRNGAIQTEKKNTNNKELSQKEAGQENPETSDHEDDPNQKKSKKKKISKEGLSPIPEGENLESATQSSAESGLPKSKLVWDGTSLIGTPQLFLVPIE